VLHLHQVAQGTFTPKLPDMSDTQEARQRIAKGEKTREVAKAFNVSVSTISRLAARASSVSPSKKEPFIC
jgi:DNA invertase Pin-like site-specific DNA recombinase